MSLEELPLRHVMVLTPTRDGVCTDTRRCVERLEALGAKRLEISGVSDVAMARNMLLTQALMLIDASITMFLLIDDDMVFDAGTAQLLVDRAEQSEHPVSAMYSTPVSLAHSERPEGRWFSGLGFMAVRVDKLKQYASRLPLLKAINREPAFPFCQCRPHPRRETWLSEDYWFCDQMDGVMLAPLVVKHLKKVPVYPDQETVNAVMRKGLEAESDDKTEQKVANG